MKLFMIIFPQMLQESTSLFMFMLQMQKEE
jgi:hypothetical protein